MPHVRRLALLALTSFSLACGASDGDAPEAGGGAPAAQGGAGGLAGGSGVGSSGAAGASGLTGGGGMAGAGGQDMCPLGTCPYPSPMLWQRPIEDYVTAASAMLDPAKLNRSITDLIEFEGRLYLGYGDATLNAGRVTPIQPRHWQSPDDAAPTIEDFVTDEEEIALYRRFGDTLYIPGVDATEDAWLGNVFTRKQGGAFAKHRTIAGGVHVHDVAVWGGALYACGSGTLTKQEWETGKVHSFLWRSSDEAASFEVADEVANTVVGDRRLTGLIPQPSKLRAYGYRTNSQGKIVEILQRAYDGTTMANDAFAPGHFLLQTELFDGAGTAVARAVNVAEKPLRFVALTLPDGGVAAPVEALAGKSVLDVHVFAPGKAVLAVADGDAYPPPEQPTTTRLLYTEDFTSFFELVSFEPPVWPTAVAYWNHGLYVGLANGEVWRSLR